MNTNPKNLSGHVCIVTGANTGIGKVTAKELAAQGAHVFLACRNQEKTQIAIDEIVSQTGAQVEYLELDLADLGSVRKAAATFLARDLPLHILVNNAGLAGTRGLTKDGFELTFGVNHLGHFLLTTLLLDVLKTSAPARIVNVSSRSHYDATTIDFAKQRQSTSSFTGMPEYSASKLANLLFSAELGRRLENTGVTTYALHPGVVASDIWHRVPWPFRGAAKLFMKSVEDGAKTSIYCASSEKVATQTGLYYDSCEARTPSDASRDAQLASQLWKQSETWIAENQI